MVIAGLLGLIFAIMGFGSGRSHHSNTSSFPRTTPTTQASSGISIMERGHAELSAFK
jgi:hypothetical protein